MKQTIIVQLAIIIELFERSGNRNLTIKHTDLVYSHGLRIDLFRKGNLVNVWELSSETKWEHELSCMCEYLTGYNDAFFVARSEL